MPPGALHNVTGEPSLCLIERSGAGVVGCALQRAGGGCKPVPAPELARLLRGKLCAMPPVASVAAPTSGPLQRPRGVVPRRSLPSPASRLEDVEGVFVSCQPWWLIADG